ELGLELPVVLDDAVEHDRELALVAAGERVRVVLGHAAVGRPARVPEPGRRLRAVRAHGALEVREVADRAHVLESAVFEQRDAGGVVAAELEPLEARDQQLLGGPAPDVSDDPAHPPTPSLGPENAKARLINPPP